MSYFNLFIQKGMFHSHTCIQIITIDGRTFDLEKKSNKIIASHDRTLRSCEAAASIVHVINTPADMQLWKHLFFLLNFKACAVPLHTDSWSSVLTKPHKKKKSTCYICKKMNMADLNLGKVWFTERSAPI